MSTASSSDNENNNTPSPPAQSQNFAQLATPSSTRNLSQQSRGGVGPAAAALELTPPVSQPSFSPATGQGGGGSGVTVFGPGGRSLGSGGKEAEFTNIDEAVGLAADNTSYAQGGQPAPSAALLSARRDEHELALSKVVEGKSSMTRFGDLFDERHMSLKAKK